MPPHCGRIDFDISGTAQGVWFNNAITTPIQGVASLVTDNVLPDIQVFSIGAIGPSIDGIQYYLSTEATGRVRRPFASVTADGSVYCFDQLNRVRTLTAPNLVADLIVLLQLQADGRLRIEGRNEGACGAGPWTFTAAAVTLDR
jgi:hypothetical protein